MKKVTKAKYAHLTQRLLVNKQRPAGRPTRRKEGASASLALPELIRQRLGYNPVVSLIPALGCGLNAAALLTVAHHYLAFALIVLSDGVFNRLLSIQTAQNALCNRLAHHLALAKGLSLLVQVHHETYLKPHSYKENLA